MGWPLGPRRLKPGSASLLSSVAPASNADTNSTLANSQRPADRRCATAEGAPARSSNPPPGRLTGWISGTCPWTACTPTQTAAAASISMSWTQAFAPHTRSFCAPTAPPPAWRWSFLVQPHRAVTLVRQGPTTVMATARTLLPLQLACPLALPRMPRSKRCGC
jgi:hypothetical protein